MVLDSYLYICLLSGYVLGSIPFSLILTRIWGGQDLRQVGSGNLGATNVLRTGNKKLAALTLILDMAKGFLPVLMISYYMPQVPIYAVGCALSAVLGHVFPVWLTFKGGKGVATALGVYFALSWPIGLWVVSMWIACAKLTRISSLAALIALNSAPFGVFLLVYWKGNIPFLMVFSILIAALMNITHRDNWRRLIKGEESKIQL